MNIFFVDNDPYDAARQLVDKHVVKMIVESAQLLSTAHRLIDGNDNIIDDERQDVLYKVTHRNHPCSVWVRESIQNYLWLVDHFHGLLQEYTHRYGKTHKCQSMLYVLQTPPVNLKNYDWTSPPSCMPDEYKVGTLVDNYRQYYRLAKAHIHNWKYRDRPSWV